jgi:hypothetical protein
MTNGRAFPFTELYSADLLIDAIYQGGRKGNAATIPFRAYSLSRTRVGFGIAAISPSSKWSYSHLHFPIRIGQTQ